MRLKATLARLGIAVLWFQTLQFAFGNELYFQKGLDSYHQQNYAEAIKWMDKVYWEKGKLTQRALLYIITSQLLLGQRERAIDNLVILDLAGLPAGEWEMGDKLKNKYGIRAPTVAVKTPWYFDITPYIGNVKFDKRTVKDSSQYKGVGVGLSKNIFRADVGYEELQLNYNSRSAVAGFAQKQWAFMGTIYPIPSLDIKATLTQINNNFSELNDVLVLTLGYDYFKDLSWQTGLSYSHTNYPHFAQGALNVNQYVLYLGKSFGRSLAEGLINITLKYYYIRPTVDEVNIGSKDDLLNREFQSLAISTSYVRPSYSVQIEKWLGNQNFAVKNNGFVVYNLSERHTGGIAATLNLNLGARTILGASVQQEDFVDKITKETSSANNFMLKLTWKNY